ncbi:MAG: hypothetical protein JNM89_10235 [Hyphomicrobiaceae bacterium]|nr:hypothetical protein [Hyphomicrobiaceae bacterium]
MRLKRARPRAGIDRPLGIASGNPGRRMLRYAEWAAEVLTSLINTVRRFAKTTARN